MEQKLKKLLIFLAILGLIGFVANLLVDNPYTHRLIRTALNEKIKVATNISLDFKAIKVSVVPPGVDLYGIFVATNIKPDEPLISASHARARLSLWSLLLGEIKIARLEANDLTLIWPPPFGFAGFVKPDPKASPPPPSTVTWPPDLPLTIETISLKNARIYAEIPLKNKIPEPPSFLVTSLVGLDLDIAMANWNDIELDLKAHAVNLALDAASIVEEASVAAKGELVDGKLNISSLKLDGERVKVDGKISGEFETTPMSALRNAKKKLMAVGFTVDGAVKGDLSVLGSFLDLPETRGPVEGRATVEVSIPVEASGHATYLIKGHGQVNDSYLYGFRLFESKASFEVDQEAVHFPELEVILAGQSYAKGSGKIRLRDMNFDFNAAPENLRLADLLDALKVSFDIFDTSITSPDLRIFGRAKPFALNVTATSQFSEITLPSTPYDQTRFPESPACRFDFHLAVRDEFLSFDRTNGLCFRPEGQKLAMPVAGQVVAPPGAAELSPLSVGGRINFEDGIGLQVRSDDLQLGMARYFAQIPLAGTAQLETRIHGPFDAIVIDNDVSVQDLEVRDIPLGDVTGKVAIIGHEVQWHNVNFDLDGQGHMATPSGKLMVDDEFRMHAKIEANDVRAPAVQRALHAIVPDLPLAFGIASLKGELEGPLRYPFAYKGDLKVSLRDMTYEGETLFNEADADVISDKKGWSAQDLSARLGALRLKASFKHEHAFPFSFAEADGSTNPWVKVGLHPDDRFDISFATEKSDDPKENFSALPKDDQRQMRVDHLATLPFVGKTLGPAGITGELLLSGKLSGTAEDLQGTFDGSLRDPTILGSVQAPVDFKGFVKNGRLDVTLNHSGNTLEGRLSVDVMKPRLPYEWFFSMNRMDLRALGTAYFHKDPRNFIYASANWRMQGELSDWWRSTGELDVKDIRAKYVQDIGSQTRTLQIRQEQPVKLVFGENGWRFDEDKDLYLGGRYTQLRVSMTDNKPPERLGIKIESVVDMAILKEFSQRIDTAKGKVRLVAEIKGSVASPEIAVEVTDLKPNPLFAATWTSVTLGLSDLRPEFKNIRARILYSNGRIVIDSLQADKGGGSISASGSLNLGTVSEEESRLDIALNDATLIYPVAVLKTFEAQASGNITLSGQGFPYKVAGDIAINRGRSTSEVDIRDEIINALRRQSFTTSVVAEKPLVAYDLNVTAKQSINIHNRNMQVLLSTDLQIKGTDIAPSVLGQLEVDKGKFIYKRDFQITRGLVTFDNPIKPDPSVDILAVSEVDAYRVYIAVSGRASNPQIEFAVDPPTREDGSSISKIEILVLLSRGKLPEANRSIGETTSGAATSEAINLIMGQFEEPVEKLLDFSGQSVLRNVFIDTHPSPDGDPVPRLNLPLDLGENVEFVFRTDQSTNEFAAEYNVHENITASGTLGRRRGDELKDKTSTQPVSDVDAKLNLKFRFSFE